ncbi:MAG: MGMT family protein [Anaerolineae bacterium]|nr:MGMT family protein [Gloeobacterales cyanobacterium ES-bin-313]
MSNSFERIYAVVRCIPTGKVATYGQIARLAGLGRGARVVGYALFQITPGSDVPWQRVVNAQGEISESPHRQGNDDYQRILLKSEGIIFDEAGRIDLTEYRWQPDVAQCAKFASLT